MDRHDVSALVARTVGGLHQGISHALSCPGEKSRHFAAFGAQEVETQHDRLVLTTGNLRPRGLSGFGTRVFEVLEAHVVSPWHLLASTCAWKGIDPLALTAPDLVVLAPLLSEQVARITDERHGLRLMHALQALANTP